MTIYAYEVRDDEKEYFKMLSKKYDLKIRESSKLLDCTKLRDLEPGSGVTVLGQKHYGDEEMRALSEAGVHYLSIRTIGYNHFDLEAAKKSSRTSSRTGSSRISGSSKTLSGRSTWRFTRMLR